MKPGDRAVVIRVKKEADVRKFAQTVGHAGTVVEMNEKSPYKGERYVLLLMDENFRDMEVWRHRALDPIPGRTYALFYIDEVLPYTDQVKCEV